MLMQADFGWTAAKVKVRVGLENESSGQIDSTCPRADRLDFLTVISVCQAGHCVRTSSRETADMQKQ
jgi:hypothetical protein